MTEKPRSSQLGKIGIPTSEIGKTRTKTKTKRKKNPSSRCGENRTKISNTGAGRMTDMRFPMMNGMSIGHGSQQKGKG